MSSFTDFQNFGKIQNTGGSIMKLQKIGVKNQKKKPN